MHLSLPFYKVSSQKQDKSLKDIRHEWNVSHIHSNRYGCEQKKYKMTSKLMQYRQFIQQQQQQHRHITLLMVTRCPDRKRPMGPRPNPFEKKVDPPPVYSNYATEVYPDPTPTNQTTQASSPNIPSGIVGILTSSELHAINGPCPIID